KKCGARDSGADGQFAPACPAFLLHWKHAGQGVQAGGGEMLLVAVVVVPAETGGDLPERAGVLTALMAVDEFAQARVADADDEHLANRRRQGRHARVRHRVAVACDDERGAARAPIFRQFTSLLDSIEDTRFADGESLV